MRFDQSWTSATIGDDCDKVSEEFAMRWDDFRRSDNVEDSRGDGGGFGGGGGMGLPDRRRRARYRNYHRARSDRLGARHRSKHPDRRRRDRERRRGTRSSRTSRSRGKRQASRQTRWAILSPPCSAIPKTPGRKFSSRAGSNTACRGCACTPARCRAVAASRKRRWDRSIARTIGASILIPLSFAISQRALPRLQRQGLRIRRSLCDRA